MNESFDEFKKVNKENLSDQIIRQIKEMIEKGILKPEDKLPPERDLAQKLGVSRLPLREALKILQFINVLDLRPGEGYVVKGLETANLLDILENAVEPGQNILNDLKEMRITLEVKATELACMRRTDKDLKRMLEAIEEMEIAVNSNDDEKIIRASLNYHNSLMKASHNKLFIAILACFSDVINEGRKQSLIIKGRYRLSIDEHRAIYEAVKERDVKTATELMKLHLETSYYNL
ncbi:MAG: FadR/GntR family transcriptional regulator [Peptococcaceae bacterium]|jgi:GntR family transcriptional repressor for pyruvate dehydrogenase complex|nr:FadR family transcriptional regulator [Peptococcaceae bacterium]MDH7525010.1 FadR/GntR family transcriptional regulator [Peptococcaceae bacterium]